MGLNKADRDRLDRLAGSGKGWGGGLPLPLLFDALFNELLDKGSASTTRLIDIAREALGFKAQQIITNQAMGGDRAGEPDWTAFTWDILEQMSSQKLITEGSGDNWLPSFAVGEPLTVIPADKQGRPAYTTVIWPREERDARSDATRTDSDATSLIARPNPVKRDVVARLRQSAEEVGPQYPILTDASGRIIDGHHRYEADPAWPSVKATRLDGTTLIETNAEVLALIRALDIRRPPLPEKTRQNIDKILDELAATNQIKRDRIRAELLRDASRSNRAIANLVGTDEGGVTVGAVREELLNLSSIHDYLFSGGRGVSSGKHSADCWCGEGATEPPKTKAKNPTPTSTEHRQQEIDLQVAERLARGEKQTEIGRALGLGDSGQSTKLAKAVGRYEGATGQTPWVEPEAETPVATEPERVELAPETLATEDHTVHECVPMAINICVVCGNRLQ